MVWLKLSRWWNTKRKHALHLHYTCITCITIDSVMKMEKKNYPQVYLEECKYKSIKIKMSKFINADLESDIELELKPELESDTE